MTGGADAARVQRDELLRQHRESLWDDRYIQREQTEICQAYRDEARRGLSFDCEVCDPESNGSNSQHRRISSISKEVSRRGLEEIQSLLFDTAPAQGIADTGENWNGRFQEALDMPEDTPQHQYRKYMMLTTLNRDFVHAAVTYGQTIISEYFVHTKDKSIRPRRLGGIAGGRKYLWRGILFKLADGSTGPYCGNDEAAAKGAGHDLRGATHYFSARVPGLHFALQCVIDYKGFRMTAQAWLPLGEGSLRYGTADAAKTVYNKDPELSKLMQDAAKELKLREHIVNGKAMHSACDVEGHLAQDGRYYLLDFARTFPPESPETEGLPARMLMDGTPVYVQAGEVPPAADAAAGAAVPGAAGCGGAAAGTGGGRAHGRRRLGVVSRAVFNPEVEGPIRLEDVSYDILMEDGTITNVPSWLVKDQKLTIFWNMLRPEFVKQRGASLLHRFNTRRIGGSKLSGGIFGTFFGLPPPVAPPGGDGGGCDRGGSTPGSGRSASESAIRFHVAPPAGADLGPATAGAGGVEHEAAMALLARGVLGGAKGDSDDGGRLGGGNASAASGPTRMSSSAPASRAPSMFASAAGGGRFVIGGGGGGGYAGFGSNGGGGGGGAGAYDACVSRRYGEYDPFISGGSGVSMAVYDAFASRSSSDFMSNGGGGAFVGGGGSGGGGGGNAAEMLWQAVAAGASRTTSAVDGGGGYAYANASNGGYSTFSFRTGGGESSRWPPAGGRAASFAAPDPASSGGAPQRLRSGFNSGTAPLLSPLLEVAASHNADSSVDGHSVGGPELFEAPAAAGFGGGPPAGGSVRDETSKASDHSESGAFFDAEDGGEYGSAYAAEFEAFEGRAPQQTAPSLGVNGAGASAPPTARRGAPATGSAVVANDVNGGCNGGCGGSSGGNVMAGGPDGGDGSGSVPLDGKDGLWTAVFEASAARHALVTQAAGEGACVAFGAASAQQDSIALASRTSSTITDNPAQLRQHMVDEYHRKAMSRAPRGIVPLNPDAFSSFSRSDPKAVVYNADVHSATKLLLTKLLPALADNLCRLPPSVLEGLPLGTELHRHGVNIRHAGMLRAIVPDVEANSLLREMLLTEIVARTLKNMLRDFQRKWMKAKRSTSEQGMHALAVQFLNLVTGAHRNSEAFWRDRVCIGVLQRFGVEALTPYERQHLRHLCAEANLLKTCVVKLMEMQGLILTNAAETQFLEDPRPSGFQFVTADIVEVKPCVTYMHILDYGGGVMLAMQASELAARNSDARIVTRLNFLAKQHFITAHQSLPCDQETLKHLEESTDAISMLGEVEAATAMHTTFAGLDNRRGVLKVEGDVIVVNGGRRRRFRKRDRVRNALLSWAAKLSVFCPGTEVQDDEEEEYEEEGDGSGGRGGGGGHWFQSNAAILATRQKGSDADGRQPLVPS